MPIPILKTKLYAPPGQPELVRRPRLLDRLNAGLKRKLTLVCAPAGFGKTTLVSAWIQRVGRPVAWLSVDEGDNDPARFWAYLLAALQTVKTSAPGAAISEATRLMLQNPQSLTETTIETCLITLINDITDTFPPFILVLDDLHILTDTTIHEGLTFLLDNHPPQMHLAASTRADPPWPLARMRARNQMTELRQSDLRFTPEETSTFLNDVMRLPLSPTNVTALQTHTEGWIAGLQMAALSIQGLDEQSVAHFITNFSGRHHFILDYLTDEVLKRQPQPLQNFLLHTSVLDRLCGDLCDALLDSPATSQTILEHLQQSNLFLISLDSERVWYRYHHLFADLLRARLQQTHPDVVVELHRRAATWHNQHDFTSEAIHHALAAETYEWAADMLEQALQKIYTWPTVTTVHLQQWLDRLPDDVLHARPRLHLIAARVFYVTRKPEAAERLLQTLESILKDRSSDPETETLLGLLTADRASYAAVQGQVRKAIDLAQQALAHLPEDSLTTRMRVASILGMAHFRAGDVAESAQAFSQAIAAAEAADIAFAATPLACNLADVQITQGQLREAQRTCQQGIRMGTVNDKPTSSLGYAYLAMAKVLYEQNDLSAAAQYAHDGLKHLEQAGTPDSFGTGHAVLARIQQAQRDKAGALAAIEKACDIARRSNIPRMIHLIGAYQARIWLAQGDLVQATGWAQNYRQLDSVEYLREFEDLTLARVLLAEGKVPEALALLDIVQPPAESAGRTGSVLEMLILRSLALHTRENLRAALATLKHALALAAPEGYIRIFADEGKPMAMLLSRIHTSTGEQSLIQYSQQLLSAFADKPEKSALPHLTQPLIEPLTGRERDVLRLIAEGLTNPEIAQRLFISLPTVKSHTRNIYGKLDVHSRSQAITRSQELGLLP